MKHLAHTSALLSSSLPKKMVLLMLLYFQPIQYLIIGVLVFIAADWITGVWVSLKRGRRISSIRLRKTVEKLVLYPLAVMIAFIFEREFIGPGWHLPRIVGAYIAMTEIISIFENISIITGESLFSKLAKKIKATLAKWIKDENGTSA